MCLSINLLTASCERIKSYCGLYYAIKWRRIGIIDQMSLRDSEDIYVLRDQNNKHDTRRFNKKCVSYKRETTDHG